MRQFIFILLLFASSGLYCCYGEGSPASPLISLQDTVIFDLSQAQCNSGYMEFPVYINSDEAVYALDFSMKFDPANMSFITAINLKPYLVTSAWFNASDSTLRFSSYSMQPVDNNIPLVKLRFSLPSAQINFASFDSVYTLLNGDDCNRKFIDPVLPVNIGVSGAPIITPGDSLMLSVNIIPGVDYLWSTGETSNVIYVNSPGTYTVTVAFVLGCKSESAINISEPTPLPVEWNIFEVDQVESGVQLFWSTASEIFNDYFDIERLNENEEWNILGRIQGAGSSTNSNSYHFLDANPVLGVNIYRLRQVDFDGESNYSVMREVMFREKSEEFKLKVYPNPAKACTDVNVEINCLKETSEGILSIIDQKGVEILHHRIRLTGSEINTLLSQIFNCNKLNAGIYTAQFIVDGQIACCRFVVY